MFGGEILKTFDLSVNKDLIGKTKIRIYLIKPTERPNDRDIGIEVTESSMFGFHVYPITLTAFEALELSSLIENTFTEKGNDS